MRGDPPLSTLHNILKMLLSPHSSNMPPHHTTDVAEDVDEPPDQHILHGSTISADEGLIYVKSPAAVNQKESLLTRALKTSPDLVASDRHHSDYVYHHPYPYHNVSGISTAELTSDGGMTSPSLSYTPSPPFPSHLANRPPPMTGKGNATDASESAVEANLGRRRCISFACGRKVEEPKQQPQGKQPTTKEANPEPTPTEQVKRRTTIKFLCPTPGPETKRDRPPGGSARPRPRGSPAPIARKPSTDDATPPVNIPTEQPTPSQTKGVPTSGLGKFEDSEATRFHEFASSVDDDDEWVKHADSYAGKITMDDCMKKENAIRKLGEEAEEEALNEEDEEDDDDDEEDEEDDDDDDVADDDSTIHDFFDDGNESDNEAGFADSDDSDASDTEFWAPATATATTTPQVFETSRAPMDRRYSNTSIDSCTDERRWSPAFSRKGPGRRPSKTHRTRPSTPNLPDSTDFVCGTLDEDRPLEVAYKSCMERRRMSKKIVIPQDIDPSFPTSDPEDNDDGDNDVMELPGNDESARGRTEEQIHKPSPHRSPRRMMSPPPRRQGRSPPKRLRSPPPPMKLRSPNDDGPSAPAVPRHGVNISELVQRRPMVNRTKSLPRTPNPFFTSLEESSQYLGISPLGDSELESSRAHTRGPIDIVEGLEKKRQKRKEKFWRQHCRKAAKEQMERRRVPGKGAERMKELGLEVAERCRAYGVGQDAQLMLSV